MSKEKKSGVGKFVLGAAIGASLGLLFAPKSGKETRKDLKNKLDEFMGKVKELDAKEVKDAFEKKVNEIKASLEDLDREKVLKIAKEKATQIKEKCNELVDMAIDKGTPIVRDTAEEVRQKSIVVVRGVLEKLEAGSKESSSTTKRDRKKKQA